MLLVDATYIHDGGTRVLLHYLMEKLSATDKEVFYLLDERLDKAALSKSIKYKTISHIRYYERHQFFIHHKNKFSTVLCFNSLPPSTRLRAKAMTYLHSAFYLQPQVQLGWAERLLFYSKNLIFSYTKKYTDKWIVQTHAVATDLNRIHQIDKKNITVLPFFIPEKSIPCISKIKNTFLYAGNALAHKNHVLLITAFCKFYDKHQKGTLTLTVDTRYKKVYRIICQKIQEGYPIQNIGFVSKEVLAAQYARSAYYIHPSLAESFGLGLVEAVAQHCKVLAADLPYTYEVCVPSAVFNPQSEAAIYSIFERAVFETLPQSLLVVENKIEDLIASL